MKKRGRRPVISEQQERILLLRDEQKLSWSKIAVEVGITRGNCAKLAKRARKVLSDRAARLTRWEGAEGTRYTESQWARLSTANRKQFWYRSSFPPDAEFDPPRPKQIRSDRPWNRPDNELLTTEEKAHIEDEQPIPTLSAPLPQPTIAPAGLERVYEPITQPAPVPVAAPVPTPEESKVRLVLDWNERAYDGSPIYRDRDGNPVEVVSGSGPRANRLFLAESNETVELAIARVFRRGEWLLRLPDGTEREVEMENPDSYESEHQYQIRRAVYLLDKRPRVSWLRILKIGQLIDTSRLADHRALRNDALAEQSRLQRRAREQAASRSEFVKAIDSQRQEERRAEKPTVDLSDPQVAEEIYFRDFR